MISLRLSFILITFVVISSSLSTTIPGEPCSLESRTGDCSTEFQGVFAYSQDPHCENGLCIILTPNICTACINPLVSSYVEVGEFEADKIYCDTDYRPEFCLDENQPVCAFTEDEELVTTYYGMTVSNPCRACMDMDVVYYVPGGECQMVAEEVEVEVDEVLEIENHNQDKEITEFLKSLEKILDFPEEVREMIMNRLTKQV